MIYLKMKNNNKNNKNNKQIKYWPKLKLKLIKKMSIIQNDIYL